MHAAKMRRTAFRGDLSVLSEKCDNPLLLQVSAKGEKRDEGQL